MNLNSTLVVSSYRICPGCLEKLKSCQQSTLFQLKSAQCISVFRLHTEQNSKEVTTNSASPGSIIHRFVSGSHRTMVDSCRSPEGPSAKKGILVNYLSRSTTRNKSQRRKETHPQLPLPIPRQSPSRTPRTALTATRTTEHPTSPRIPPLPFMYQPNPTHPKHLPSPHPPPPQPPREPLSHAITQLSRAPRTSRHIRPRRNPHAEASAETAREPRGTGPP